MMDVKSMMSMDVMNFSLVGDGLGFLATVSRSSSTKEHHCPRSAWMLLCWNAFVNFIVESNRAEMQRPCKYFKFQPRLSLPNWPQNLQEIQLRLWTTASTFLVTSNFHVRCFQHQPSAQIHSRLWRIISIAHQAGSHRRTPDRSPAVRRWSEVMVTIGRLVCCVTLLNRSLRLGQSMTKLGNIAGTYSSMVL